MSALLRLLTQFIACVPSLVCPSIHPIQCFPRRGAHMLCCSRRTALGFDPHTPPAAGAASDLSLPSHAASLRTYYY